MVIDLIEQLSVKNYVLFDSCIIDFNTGMSVITGETGAGKSLLIDAIGLLCGNRVVGDVVRKGTDKAILTMVLSSNPIIEEKLSENGFVCKDQIIITRIINANGKSSIRINQQISTLNFVKEIVSSQIDIHSQMDTYHLIDSSVQLELLDNYCQANDLKNKLSDLFQSYKTVCDELDHLKNEEFSDDELDYLTSQLNEIENADIQENELKELQEKITLATSWNKDKEEISNCLYEINKENGIMDSLYHVYKNCSKSNILKEYEQSFQDMYYSIQSLDEEIKSKKNNFENNNYDLDELQQREYLIRRLYKKYGGSFESLNERKNKILDKIDRIIHKQDVFEKLEKQKELAYENYMHCANELSKKRKSKMQELENLVEQNCRDLMLEKARFKISCKETNPSMNGIDQIDFMVSMNPGQDFSSLKTSASGGELSRLMLALKVVFQSTTGIETIIFDEIDTGVSGKVALSMGAKMKKLSDDYQVLCITHLPSVAVYANTHYCVEKTSNSLQTVTNVKELNHEEVIHELAIMSNGQDSELACKSMESLWEKVHG